MTLVINCSPRHYNLGAAKLANWLRSQGDIVEEWNGAPGLFALGHTQIYLSVIFSWDALLARDIALYMKDKGDVACGGPGMFALQSWWKKETGLTCCSALDSRFERQQGRYHMTFASRGCPVNCYFCIVPRLEHKHNEYSKKWICCRRQHIC